MSAENQHDRDAIAGRVDPLVMGRDTPERILRRNSCVLCGCPLLSVKRDGCGAIYADSRESCEQDGWAVILGDEKAA